MKRTKAIEILDEAKIRYEVGEFDATELTAEEVAAKLNLPLESVFKTLVCQGDKSGYCMAVVPGDKELNLKKLAKLIGDKKCDLIPLNDLQRLTGYLKGGCSPLGGKKTFPIYIDSSANNFGRISVSAGLRGLQVFVAANDLARAAKAKFGELVD
uniref:YbaK/ebsC protein n=1 Tax=wastewater metagenome TaxID=527639 RepID=A0A0A8KXP3_9ZZZZ